MSKLSPLGQSIAALFQSNRDRQQSTAGTTTGPSFSVPGSPGITSKGAQDSLGNPNSPGYDRGNPQKKKGDLPTPGSGSGTESAAAPSTTIETPTLGPQFIRLSHGWEKLLLTQKKICAKAKGLFTSLEGPGKYTSQKKSRLLLVKSRGCILDLDSQDASEQEKAVHKHKDSA